MATTAAERATSRRDRTGALKVLQVGGRRRAFRLEPAFWDVLGEMAAARHIRLGLLVSELLGTAPDGNATSALRVAAILELQRQRSVAQMGGGSGFHRRLFETAPTPALLLSESTRILAHNEALLTWLGQGAQTVVGRLLQEAFQIRTTVPWAYLWAQLRNGDRDTLVVPVIHLAPGRVTAAEATVLRSPGPIPYRASAFVWLMSRGSRPEGPAGRG